jgi:tRNA nucleotidyltransferase/poly(A) polymerase
LHDAGKPATWTIDENGRHRFIKHDEVGAEQVFELLKRLKFSKNAISYMTALIRHHLYPSQLIREGLDRISDKALMRFFRRITDNTPDLLLLALCDRLSARGPNITPEMIEKNMLGTQILLEKYETAGQEAIDLPRLVGGNDVMELLGIPRCPKVGKVLGALKEAQIAGDINTRDEALEFIKNFKG